MSLKRQEDTFFELFLESSNAFCHIYLLPQIYVLLPEADSGNDYAEVIEVLQTSMTSAFDLLLVNYASA